MRRPKTTKALMEVYLSVSKSAAASFGEAQADVPITERVRNISRADQGSQEQHRQKH